MLTALDSNNKKRLAWLTEKAESPFYCPECQAELLLKKGLVRQHHFSHKPNSDCHYSSGESQLHLQIKKEIYEALKDHPNCARCELERNLGVVRPDVSLYINNEPVAIEIQKSDISIELILKRFAHYTEKGIHLLWILPKLEYDLDYEVKVLRVKKWQELLSLIYQNRLYFWESEANISLANLKPFERFVPDYYDREYGELGGYYKELKSKREIRISSGSHIAKDFQPTENKYFMFSGNIIPKYKIWTIKKDR